MPLHMEFFENTSLARLKIQLNNFLKDGKFIKKTAFNSISVPTINTKGKIDYETVHYVMVEWHEAHNKNDQQNGGE